MPSACGRIPTNSHSTTTCKHQLTLRICTEPVDVGASLVGAHATPRIQLAGSDEGNHKSCPYKA